MAQPPTVAEPRAWHRWFAIEANNRAWRLAEAETRSAAEDAEMLTAAHAAAFHWSQVGTPLNIARAQMLLGHVHALLGDAKPALAYARASFDFVASHPSPDWEVAFAHAVLANAGAAARDRELHRKHYAEAKTLGDALQDEEERAIFAATFRRIPASSP
jgi:hypothetical protein